MITPTRLCICGDSNFDNWLLFSRSIDDFCAGDRALIIVTKKITGELNKLVDKYAGPMLLLREIYHANYYKWPKKKDHADEWRDQELIMATDKLIIFLPEGRKAKKNRLYRMAKAVGLQTRKVFY